MLYTTIGAHVHIYIHTTEPYTVALIDLLNTRVSCRDGGIQVNIILKSPAVRLNLVDCHRELFYDKLDEYDIFIYSEVRVKLEKVQEDVNLSLLSVKTC